MDQEYETMSPPGSPGGSNSINSSNLTTKQYFCVNLSKFTIELIGTAVFTMLFYMMNGRYSSVLLSLWVITLFGMNISGAHFNPCVTLAQMIRKSSSFGRRRRRLLGIMYLFAQLLGGIAGSCAVATLLKEGPRYRINVMPSAYGCEYRRWDYDTKIDDEVINCRYDLPKDWQNPTDDPEIYDQPADENPNRPWKTFQSLVSETFGTFIYVLFFMICTDEKLKFSNDTVKNALVIASSYITSQLMAGGQYVTMRTGPCLNPATAFGLAIFQANFNFPQYFICPFIGCLLSVVFYEFVFVKTQQYLIDDDESEEDDTVEDASIVDDDTVDTSKKEKKEVVSD